MPEEWNDNADDLCESRPDIILQSNYDKLITKPSTSIFSVHLKTMNMHSPTAACKLFSYDASSTVSFATCPEQTRKRYFLQVNIYEQLHTNKLHISSPLRFL